MTDEVPTPENGWTITLRSPDATAHRCRILDIFDFEERRYALLLKLDEAATAPAEAPVIVMRLIEQGAGSIFQTIESDDEFARVSAQVRHLAAP